MDKKKVFFLGLFSLFVAGVPTLLLSQTDKSHEIKIDNNIPQFDQNLEEVLGKLSTLRTSLSGQISRFEKESQFVKEKLMEKVNQIETQKESLQTEISSIEFGKLNTESRLFQVNKQLFGVNEPESSDELNEINFFNSPEIDFRPNSLRSFLSAEEGSVIQIIGASFTQINQLTESCSGSDQKNISASRIRSDLTAIDFIVKDIASSFAMTDKLEWCPFCNRTFCGEYLKNCFIESSFPNELKTIPSSLLQPDVTNCWNTITEYCSRPSSKDPGCSCSVSQRCWKNGNIGKCQLISDSGNFDCEKQSDLSCQDFFVPEVANPFENPTLSFADEMLIGKLRELREKFVNFDAKKEANKTISSSSSSSLSNECYSELSSLLNSFQKVESMATALWHRRYELKMNLENLNIREKILQKDIINLEETKREIVSQLSNEDKILVERRNILANERSLTEEFSGMVGSIISPEQRNNDLGSRKEQSAISCQQIKRESPNSPSGTYWVNFGKDKSESVQVYCDMVTDGGGWTLIWKNIGGSVSSIGKAEYRSNKELIENNKLNDIVTPVNLERKSQMNHPAYEYYSTRKNQEWMKFMTLYSGPNEEIISQRIRVEFGQNTMSDIFVGNTPECSNLPESLRLYSSTMEKNLNTNYFMGETRTIIRQKNQSFGIANIGSVKDMCLQNGEEIPNLIDVCSAFDGTRLSDPLSKNSLICDFKMLRRLGVRNDVSVMSTWETLRHLFSYVHSSPSPRDSTRCMFRCWDLGDVAHTTETFNDVFVWAARGKCSDVNGTECSGRGTCIEGFCSCVTGYYGENCQNSVSCGEPEKTVIENSKYSPATESCSGNSYTDICLYECPIGYSLVGQSTVECHQDGKWTGKSAICVPRECSLPESIKLNTHTSIKSCSGRLYGDYCDVVCDFGFRYESGGKLMNCDSFGQWNWDSFPLACQEIKCQEPTAPNHSMVSLTGPPEKYGTEFSITCNSGYLLTGDKVRTCQENGLYSGSLANCVEKTCSGLPTVLGEDVSVSCKRDPTQGFTKGDICSFSCPQNKKVIGSTSMTCKDTEHWVFSQKIIPTCEVINACFDVICPATEIMCDHGKFPTPKVNWRSCCFDKDFDCAEVEIFVTESIEISGEYNPDTVTGTRNINSLKLALSTITNIYVQRIVLVYFNELPSSSVLGLAFIASSQEDANSLASTLTDITQQRPKLLLDEISKNGGNSESFNVILPPAVAHRVPNEIAHSISFADNDGRVGWIGGEVTVHKVIPPDRNTFGYNLYFGDGTGNTAKNKIGDVVASVSLNASFDSPFVYLTIPSTQVPYGAFELLLFTYSPFAEADEGLRYTFVDQINVAADLNQGSLVIVNSENRPTWFRGNVVVATSIRFGITDFVLYCGNGGDLQSDKVGPMIAEAKANLESGSTIISVNSSVYLKEECSHFLVFARNKQVEGNKGLTKEI